MSAFEASQVSSADLEGVLVREIGLHTASGLDETDGHYVFAEMQAALLGWLWSLPCTVVNRAPAWLFYRPRPSLADWAPLLHRAGLETPRMLISNDLQHLETWRTRCSEGAVLSPFSGSTHFQVCSEIEWEGVMRLSRHTPVLLEEAHGRTYPACIIGDTVIWDGAPPEGAPALELKLRKFARIAELDFLQIAVAGQPRSGRHASSPHLVVQVDAMVRLQCFSGVAQRLIAAALADFLTDSAERVRARHYISQASQRLGAEGAR